jgi:hypothetical protein
MLVSETIWKRRLVSYAEEMEQTASLLANALANVAAVVAVDVAEKKSSSSSTRTRTRGGSAPGRSFRRRIRRSVEDIYRQLGDVYFRRAYRMKYTTFKRLANDLRRVYWTYQVRKMEVNPGVFRMGVFHLMYALRVPYDGLLEALRMT